ncbi:MAG: D-alanyl-D-alanine carboxypeptidase [Clostridiales bacterium]|nr:D-alanyl-D-alanine carboxypeptidase [Clostridiales bacterium]
MTKKPLIISRADEQAVTIQNLSAEKWRFYMKKVCAFLMAVLIFGACTAQALPAMPEVSAPCAVLADINGNILLEKNSHEKRPPASVTKIMTMLLTMEAIESGELKYDDLLTVSEHAASMGGTQVYLEPGEKMSVRDLLKSVAVSSANDACVVLGERLAGSEDSFVSLMNKRAKELGMNDTNFVNCNGLHADGHITSAHDIALMSAELMKHEDIKQFTTIWMDTIRNGEFTLSNTNKLIKFYPGATGLKTGFTTESMYCISATAERNGISFIAVIMGAETIAKRSADASALLNYGFANYTKVSLMPNSEKLSPIPVNMGKKQSVDITLKSDSDMLVDKTIVKNMERQIAVEESLNAPVQKGQKVGTLTLKSGDKVILESDIIACESIERKSFFDVFWTCLRAMLMKPENK